MSSYNVQAMISLTKTCSSILLPREWLHFHSNTTELQLLVECNSICISCGTLWQHQRQ